MSTPATRRRGIPPSLQTKATQHLRSPGQRDLTQGEAQALLWTTRTRLVLAPPVFRSPEQARACRPKLKTPGGRPSRKSGRRGRAASLRCRAADRRQARGRGARAPVWPGAHPRAPDGRRRARRGRARRMLDGPHRRPEALDRLVRAEAPAAGVDLRMRRPAPRRRATALAVSAGPWRRSD
jgi:hypothetical protein